MTKIPGFCPACGRDSLYAMSGGHITCSIIECPNPTAVNDALAERRKPAWKSARDVTMPDLVAIDANGYWWRTWGEDPMWSMVPTNPDNSPIPQPCKFYRLVEVG